jgi:signal transduction histidine kinase
VIRVFRVTPLARLRERFGRSAVVRAIGRAWLRERWPIAFIAAMALIEALAVVNLASEVGRPYGGFLTRWDSTRMAWSVSPSTPPWWPVLEGAARYTDTVESLEGAARPNSLEPYAQAERDGADSVFVSLRRDGKLNGLLLPLRHFSWIDLLEVKLPDIIIGLCCCLLALYVFLARPAGAVNRAFGVAVSLFATMTLTANSLGLDPRAPLTDWLAVIEGIGGAFVSVAFVRLALVFPRPVAHTPRRALSVLYLCAGAAALFRTMTYLLLSGYFGSARTGIFLAWSGLLDALGVSIPLAEYALYRIRAPLSELEFFAYLDRVGVFLVLGLNIIGAACFAGRTIWLATRKQLPRRVRRQVWFLLAGLPFVAVDSVRALYASQVYWHGLDLRWGLLPLAICLAVVVVRYHSFKRLPTGVLVALMVSLAGMAAAVGTWVLRLLGLPLGPGASLLWFVSLMTAALAGTVFWSAMTWWRGGFARLMHWDRVSYSAARRFGQELLKRGPALPEAIAGALVTHLELERAAVWLSGDDEDWLVLAGYAGDWPQPARRTLPADVLRGAGNGHSPCRLEHDLALQLFGAAEETPAIEVLQPLWVDGRVRAAFGLGKRWDDEVFDDRDLEILELVVQQAALFLLTDDQMAELRKVPSRIAAIQERERFKIAQELHDTIQQFLGRLPFLLEVSRQAAADNPKEAESILEACINEVGGAAQTVREIQSNLAPRYLAQGLSQPLRVLVERFQARTGIAAVADISPLVDDTLGLDARHALYRVVQQALDNVAAHAHAQTVQVVVTRQEMRIHFAIVDDGCGIDEGARRQAEERGGFGLESMSARIAALQGELSVEGGSGAGTRIAGWLPAAGVG